MSENEQSSETVYRIYATGFDDAGVSMTMEQLNAAFASGRVNARDLVWIDDVWRPLSEVFDVPPPPPEEPSENLGLPEIALVFRELLPAKDVMRQAAAGEQKVSRTFKEWFVIDAYGEKRKWGFYAKLGACAIVLLALVYMFVLDPMITRMMWRPACILVINPSSSSASVVFGGKTYEVPGTRGSKFGTVTVKDIFGRLPRTEDLTFRCQEFSDTISVDLDSDVQVLVNPGGKRVWGLLEREADTGCFPAELQKAILGQLAGNTAPEGVAELLRRAIKVGDDILTTCNSEKVLYSTDDFVRNTHFCFEKVGLEHSQEDIEHRLMRGEKIYGYAEMPAVPDVVDIRNNVQLKDNVRIMYSFRDDSYIVTEVRFTLSIPRVTSDSPDTALRFNPLKMLAGTVAGDSVDYELLSGDIMGSVSVRGNKCEIVLMPKKSDNMVALRMYDTTVYGQWRFHASCVLPGKNLKAIGNVSNWDWKWTYEGKEKGGRGKRVSFTLNKNKGTFKPTVK